MQSFIERLRERKLDRVGAAYAVISWVLVQAASIALPAFEMPGDAMKWLIVSLAVGFPIALGAAWMVVEPGEVRTPAPVTRRDMVMLGILAGVVVLGFAQFALSRYWAAQPVAPQTSSALRLASIAVLPFANMSGDPAKAYFSDGIADQLITELSRRRELRVAARTSSFAFNGRDADVRKIGHALGVGAIVEGSVREDGNHVRIVAELINASDGFQIWSQTYDRDMTNILSLQEEIARAISNALSEKLMGRPAAPEPEASHGLQSINPTAYRDFLEGKYYFAQRSEDGIRHAIAMFEQVTELAPNYAEGFAALGNAHATLALNFGKQDSIPPALGAIKQALAIDNANPTALLAHATISLVQWNWRVGADDILRVEKSGVGSPLTWHSRAVFFSYMGLPELTLPSARRAVEIDPLSYIDRYNYALYLLILGQQDEALRVAREGLALQPANMEGQALVCQVQAARKDIVDARRIADVLAAQTGPDASPGPAAACAYYIAIATGDTASARAVADAAAKGFPANGVNAMDIGIAYGHVGDFDAAFQWLERAYQLREPWLPAMAHNNPDLSPLYADPRWPIFRAKPELRMWENMRGDIAHEFQPGE